MGVAEREEPKPNMARHDGASCDVSLHAIPLTVIRTIPTPVENQQ